MLEESLRGSPQTARVQWDALLASFLLASPPPKTLQGVELADNTLHTVSPRATLLPGGDAKNNHRTWHQCHGQASPSPFRRGDITEAGPHGPNALLLIPLKLRDGAQALSGFPPPLASILLAPEPKKARPPHLGAGHERQKKTLQDLGNARRKAGKLERKRSPTTPIYSCEGHQASSLSKGEGLDRP